MTAKILTTALEALMPTRQESVNPSAHPDEVFELFSIPAYENNKPEILPGGEIGSAKKTVQPEDVLLSRIVPHIRRAWVVPESNGKRQIASGEWIVFRGPRFCPSYLRHFLMSDVFHRQFMNTVAGVGGSLLRARPQYVGNIEIPLPPLSEQKRIAEILDKADAIRRKRGEATKHLDDVIQAAFLELVGPGAKEYELWPKKKIEALASPQKGSMRTGPFGSDLRHSEFVDEGIAVLGIDNAVQNRFVWDERRYITEEKYHKLRRYTVYPKDVIITIMGTTGRSAVVPGSIPTAITTKHLVCITLNLEIAEPEFISNSVHRHPGVLAQIGVSHRGAIMPGLNLTLIKSLQLHVPPIERQRQFACFVEKVRRHEGQMWSTKEQADNLFNSLVQRAFKEEL